MATISLKPILHRQQEAIGIFFSNDVQLNYAVRAIPGVKWSQANKCWWLAMEQENYNRLSEALKAFADIDKNSVQQYLDKRKKLQATKPATAMKKKYSGSSPASPALHLSEANLEALTSFQEQLKLKAYSPSTIRTYRNELLQLLQVLKNKSVKNLTEDELRRYFVYCFEKLRLSENTLHSRINAVKFYFEQVLKRDRFIWDIPRPKKAIELPRTFSQDEIAAIINSIKNKKHKAMLMLAYSAGLRVSEVVSLKTYHIDSKRMVILIKRGKGKKDRLVSLSPVLLVMLREYAKEYKPEKDGYLFQGSKKGQPYSTRSLQEIIQAAKTRVGILKPGSIHSLRHSFATHLIDRGTDVTMIQKLLGHNDIKTTLRYLHTSNKDLLRIISPLDDLKLD